MSSKYYQSELDYLRDIGREFALANPRTAGLLAERSGDPDVERLLEGVAFLTARIRERIEDSVPEVIHHLTELVLPHYLQPMPSCSIVEFSPHAGALRSPERLAKGAELASKPVALGDEAAEPCTFRTVADTDLVPVTVRSVALLENARDAPELDVRFEATSTGIDVSALRTVRLFLHADLPTSSTLLMWLLGGVRQRGRFLRDIELRVGEQPNEPIALPGSVVTTPCFEREWALWPSVPPSATGYRLLSEYFAFPAKFFFVDVALDQVEWPESVTGHGFSLRFRFDAPPELPGRVASRCLRTNCVPVVNLFRRNANPIRVDLATHEYLVRAAGLDPLHAEVFAVESVTAIRPGAAARATYQRFFDYVHGEGDVTYSVTRRRSVSARNADPESTDVYLSLHRAADADEDLGGRPAGEETLSIELLCTNRSVAGRLSAGDICARTPTSPAVATFTNIMPTTPPVRPPLGKDLHWRLLSHLASNLRSLAETGALRAALELYNFQSGTELGYANSMRVKAVQDVRASAMTRVVGGAVVRGMQTTVELDGTKFASEGEAYLFAAVLDCVFASRLAINSVHDLVARVLPARREYQWRNRPGNRAIV